jgi:hypothetical protein
MTDETNDAIYRKLEFFKESKTKIHIRLVKGEDQGRFRNGYVLDVSKTKQVFIFIDDIMGELPYLFEELDPDIKPYKQEEK